MGNPPEDGVIEPYPDELPSRPVAQNELKAPATFPSGSERHDRDAILAAYLLEVDAPEVRGTPARCTVLLVTADEAGARAAGAALETAGCTVVLVSSTVMAVRTLCTRGIDVVVTDLGRSEEWGLRLRRAVRAGRPDLPVIVLLDDPVLASTWSQEDLGSIGVLQKPVEEALLVAAVRDAVLSR